jgi:phosphoglycolate phosphatase
VKRTAVCVFDLDHTLVNSPLDLRQVALAMEAFARRLGLELPARELPWYGAEILELVREEAPNMEHALMEIPVAFERRAMQEAVLEPLVTETLVQLRSQGYGTAVWTNNDSIVTEFVLSKFDLTSLFDLVITRDQVARLKPDPEGLVLVRKRWPGLPIVVVGDSWVDAAAALAGKVPFIGYHAKEEELKRRGVACYANLSSMRELPEKLTQLFGERVLLSKTPP